MSSENMHPVFIYPKNRRAAIAIFFRAGRALRGDFVTTKGIFNPFLFENQENNKIFLQKGKIRLLFFVKPVSK